jgi:beta-lactamase class A
LAGGREIGIEPDTAFPIASLVKVPVAVAVLGRIEAGELDGAALIDVPPGRPDSIGQVGLSRFRHASRVAVDDPLYLSLAISDNAATDALFDLVSPAEVTRYLRDAGISGITVRHRLGELGTTPSDGLAQTLAIGARTAGLGHELPQLDLTRANIGSARALVDLLEALWTPAGTTSAIPAEAAPPRP